MSDKECMNECTTPLRFPRRPGTLVPTGHGDDCPCCTSGATRVSNDNRPALSRFNYRIGTYGSIREFLFNRINSTAALQSWTHREPDDPAVALLEGAAILGDILTFYQETYANEAFLRTAKWRESISDLVRLLGYRLSPAVGGKATFAFELKKDEPITVPAGFPVKATLENFERPSNFETVQEITAYPWLNSFDLYRPLENGDITPQTTEFYISAPEQLLFPVEFKVGERLIVGESGSAWPTRPLHLTSAEIVIIESIRSLHGTKIFKIKGNLKRLSNVSQLTAYRIGRTFKHLGYNSAAQIVDPSEPVSSTATVTEVGDTVETETTSTIPYLDVLSSRPVRTSSGSFSDPTISLSIKDDEFPLDSEIKDLPTKVPIVIQARFAYPYSGDVAGMFDPLPELRTLVRRIEDVGTTTLTWGTASGTVSQIKTSSAIYDSIGDGNLNYNIAANDAYTAALNDAASAATALGAAKSAAATAKTNAANAAAAKTAADADVVEKIAKADALAAKAATLAVAYNVAAAALKDDATDAATVAAASAAADGVGAALTAKTDTDLASNDADLKALLAQQKRAAEEGWIFPLFALSGFLCGGYLWLYYSHLLFAEREMGDTARKVATAKGSVATAYNKANDTRRLADAAVLAAKTDAAAKERARLAKLAADDAKTDADTAAGLISSAKSTAVIAANTATSTALAAGNAAALVKTAAATYAAALAKVRAKKIVKEVRMYIRDAMFHEVTSPLLSIRRARTETTLLEGTSLNFYGTAAQVKTLKGRPIMLAKPGEEPRLMSVARVPEAFDLETYDYPQLHSVDLSDKVLYADFPNEEPSVEVYGNLADADEGKTMPEVPIGSGDATQVFQNFKIPKAPLTYHIVPENTPAETPELEIYVDGRLWTRVDTFFGRAADEQIYIVREDADGNSWVQFGDGKTGARLNSGLKNVTANYRMGSGSFGPIKADTKAQASAKLKNLDKILMPSEATGGAPAESGDNARNAAPGKVQSLGRIVSLKDFESEASAVPGVALVSASWQLVDGIPSIVVTVLMETGRGAEIDAVRETLDSYNRLRGAGLHPIEAVQGKRMYVSASVEYALKATYRADVVEPAIRLALGVNYAGSTRDEDQSGLFSLQRRRFGRAEYASSIEGTVQNVEGVLWARVTAFAQLSDSDDPKTIVPLSTSSLASVLECDANHVLSLYDQHLTLTAVMEAGN